MATKPARRCVILSALRAEYLAVRRHLSGIRERTHKLTGSVYEEGRFKGKHSTWIISMAEIGAGNVTSAVEAERAIVLFQPDAILFVGVAGGLKDVTVGDVVVATKVYGYEGGKDGARFLARPEVGRTSYPLEQRARAEARRDEWLKRIKRQRGRAKQPMVVVGPIAAGEKVVSSTRSKTCTFLRKSYGDAIAVEMEGRGLLEAAREHRVDAMIVRGISDLLDGKSKSDAAGYQARAADHAAALAFQVLDRYTGVPRGRVKRAIATTSGEQAVGTIRKRPSRTAPSNATGARVKIELRISREFETFTETEKERLIRAIETLLGMSGDLQVVAVREGSVLVEIDLPLHLALRLIGCIASERLKEFGVVSARLEVGELAGAWRSASGDTPVGVQEKISSYFNGLMRGAGAGSMRELAREIARGMKDCRLYYLGCALFEAQLSTTSLRSRFGVGATTIRNWFPGWPASKHGQYEREPARYPRAEMSDANFERFRLWYPREFQTAAKMVARTTELEAGVVRGAVYVERTMMASLDRRRPQSSRTGTKRWTDRVGWVPPSPDLTLPWLRFLLETGESAGAGFEEACERVGGITHRSRWAGVPDREHFRRLAAGVVARWMLPVRAVYEFLSLERPKH